jgi:penicillin amidase
MSFSCHRDAWGIPHLRASDLHSLAFAQGWNAATDRARQIEVYRRRAEGRASAVLGPEWRYWDRFVRQARVTDTARSAFAALDAETAAWVEAYVAGVNRGLASGPEVAPWEPWTPLAIWHGIHLLFGGGAPTKLWRERVDRVLGPEAARLFNLDGPSAEGSNGWLVDGTMTASGAPIVAGDPHRLIEKPGFYQQIRLACDEFDVIGLANPGIPGIAHFGHAGGVAWGITNAMADTQDLYRERLRRTDDGTVEAFGPDGWEVTRTFTETIEIRGEAPETVAIIETARGPVIDGTPEAGTAFSLRAPGRVAADLGFATLPKLLRANTVGDIDAALDHWTEPVNVVMAADTQGATLHRVAGRVPDRDRENRRRPVEAWEPRYTWRGWEPMPSAGIDRIATMANDRGLSAPFGDEFCPPHRADRIRGLLAAQQDWTPDAMAAVHTDTLLAAPNPLIDALAAVDGLGSDAERLRKRLLAWDLRMDEASTEAADFNALRAAVVHRLAQHPAFVPLADTAEVGDLYRPWFAVESRLRFVLAHFLTGDFFTAEELETALRDAAEEVGASAGRIAWGEGRRLVPDQTPATGAAEPGLGGDADCVLATSGVGTVIASGPAARWVWDLADREQSRWIVPFGASGEPGSHERDQFPLWRRGELAPVVTDWQELQEEYRMIDRPAVFEHRVEGFGNVAIVPVNPVEDLDLIYGWVTEERARFWGMTEHSREYVLEIYEYLDSLATHHAYLVLRDGRPVALFQTYEPAADPVGECYEVEPGDIGTHLLMAPAAGGAEAGFTGAVMLALAGFLFADPAHLRIVAEPDSRNGKAHSRAVWAGFTLGPEIELPEKRARLAFLRREDAPCNGVPLR